MSPEELLARYDVPGPRYTSYPTVPYWDTPPTQEAWLEALAGAITAGGDGAALYVHVPFCRSLCHYCGCNTFITRDTAHVDPYIRDVKKEWGLYAERLGRVRLTEVHVGGGTPTYLTAPQLEDMLGGVFAAAEVPSDAELSIEVDPRVTTREQLEVLARLGFRRVSLGVQDFDPTVQAAVNRYQTVDEVRAVTEAAREVGFTSINYDLIFGLPKQTPESITRTMEAVRELRPHRIAFYGYAHVPWQHPGMRRFKDADVPGALHRRSLYGTGRAALAEAGYVEIGMDHFGLPGDGLLEAATAGRLHRNFMGYTERRAMPLFPLGASAIGDTWTAFAQNDKTVPGWHARLAKGELPIGRGHLLDAEDLALRRLILDVMTRFETAWGEAEEPWVAQARGRLEPLVEDGLVELSPGALRVTPQGRPFVRNVCMALDARLARKAPTAPTFSRTA